jgi:hypothetical protein
MNRTCFSGIVCAVMLAATPIANASLLVFTDRTTWLAAAAGTAQLSEDFNSFTSDVLYGSLPAAAGFLTLSVVNGNSDNSWRIDAIPATFSTIPSVNGTTFATVLAAKGYGGTRLSFNSIRAFGFDYAGASYSTSPGLLTTSRGDAISIGVTSIGTKSFLGVIFTAGETFTSLTLSSTGAFAAGIDNVSAFAPAPVPELPTALLLAAGIAGVFTSNKAIRKPSSST